jgi:carboxymethylenebutenolidase
MNGLDVSIEARDGGSVPAYLAIPPDAPAPAIVLLPPIFGIEPVIRKMADGWAARGFVVLVLNQFWRDAEPGQLDRSEEGRARAMARAQRADVDQLMDDLGAALDTLRAMPVCNGKIGVVGICFGGRYAFLATARLEVGAAAAFHGTQIGASLADAPRVRAPLSLHFGEDDPITPPGEIDAIRAALRARPDAEIAVYPGATHNFSIPGNPAYDEDVATRAEQRTFALFERLR